MPRRLHGYHPELPADVLFELTRSDLGTSELILNFAEFTDRAVLAPRQRIEIAVYQDDLKEMTVLSRYASAVLTHLRAELDPDWLWNLLADSPDLLGERSEDFPRLWHVFLCSPTAAPVLRAAVARLTTAQCAEVADLIREVLPDDAGGVLGTRRAMCST